MKRFAFWPAAFFCLAQACLAFYGLLDYHAGIVEVAGRFFNFSLLADGLSLIMLFSIALVAGTALLVARRMITPARESFNFVNLLLIAVAGLNGLVMVKDIFSLYVFLEVVAVSSFILIAFRKDKEGLEGAFKYVVLSAVASAVMLASIAILLLISGDAGFQAIGAALKSSPHNHFILFAAGLFICAAFVKSGLLPFHGWLPDAYTSAPTPVSIFLAGIVTKSVGVYALIRVATEVFGSLGSLNAIFLFVGACSAALAALAALGQRDFKRMLAYSSISQMGYVVMGLGCGSALGLAAAVFHLANHAVFKSLLFVNAAAVECETGSRDMDSLPGLSRRMPLTSLTCAIGSLSCAGVPPLAGFWSKLLILVALFMSGNYLYAGIAAMASILTLAYFLSLQRRLFFGPVPQEAETPKGRAAGLALPQIVLAAITIAVGVGFPFMLQNFILPLAGWRG